MAQMMQSQFAVLPVELTPQDHSTERQRLYRRFQTKIAPNPLLNRMLVSFQANKQIPFYSWFKYREGFSHALVTHLLQQLAPQPGVLLDPFAGSGAALFAAQELGWQATGIEVLPVGTAIATIRQLAQQVDPAAFEAAMRQVREIADFAPLAAANQPFEQLAITAGAFPETTERQLAGYRAYCEQCIQDDALRQLLVFAALSMLEDISYTRKDGQYLRWDRRAGRTRGKQIFDKGPLPTFGAALAAKLQQMSADLWEAQTPPRLFASAVAAAQRPAIQLLHDSCLTRLPAFPAASVDVIFTSPPYANRYDYTRTYALELVFLGCTTSDVKTLRQQMLSCTVENKAKRAQLAALYTRLGRLAAFQTIEQVVSNQRALQEALAQLETYRRAKQLNNAQIVRLVSNYFFEMACVLFEMARVLKPGGKIIMVNDNVRYAGEEIPVDLILSDMAEQFGLRTSQIWTLGRGKGNSSQQMGLHGRTELRKCVYVWEQPL